MGGSHENLGQATPEEEGFQPRLRDAFYEERNSPTHARVSQADHDSRIRQPQPTQSSSGSQLLGTPRRQRETGREPDFIMPSSPDASEYSSSPHRKPTTRSSVKASPRASGSMRQSQSFQRPAASSAKRQHRQSTPAKTAQSDDAMHYVRLVWSSVISPVLSYLLSVISLTAGFLKPIFGFGLVVVLLAVLFSVARSALVSSVTTALSPICAIPGTGFLNLPFCGPSTKEGPRAPVEFDKLISTQAAFEDILQTSMGHANLPLAMKNSELSIRDLRTVVTYSNLPSRHELLNEFNGFIETAREASTGLTKFNSRISRSLDGILSANRWTMHVLEGISSADDNMGTIPRFISNHLTMLSPLLNTPSLRNPEDAIYDQYIRHTSEVEEQITLCIVEANSILDVLDNLDSRLDLIANIAGREGFKVKDSKDEILASIWTKLGVANRGTLAKFERQLDTLSGMERYRKTAVKHVADTLLKLREIEANLGHLKDRVAAPQLTSGVPLRLHLDMVEKAVERLTDVRDEGRRIESNRVKSIQSQMDDQWEQKNFQIGSH